MSLPITAIYTGLSDDMFQIVNHFVVQKQGFLSSDLWVSPQAPAHRVCRQSQRSGRQEGRTVLGRDYRNKVGTEGTI